MNTTYTLIGILVGFLTIMGIFMKLAYNLGQMSQKLSDIVDAVEDIAAQVKELFEWRYANAVRDQKRR